MTTEINKTPEQEIIRQAEFEISKGQFDRAIEQCEVALEAYPKSAKICKTLGKAWQGKRNFEEAQRWYVRALKLKPDFAEAYANLGSLAAIEQDWQGAIAFFQKAISLEPEFAGAYRNLAKAWEKFGNPISAADCWYEALRLQPETGNSERYLQLGDTLFELGQITQAIDCYQRAIARDETLLDAYQNVGVALKAQGRFEEATQYLKQAIGVHLEMSGNGAKKDAGKTQNSTVGENGGRSKLERSHIYIVEAETAIENRNWQGAIAASREALKIQPQDATACKLLGNALQRSNQLEEAQHWYLKALEIEPNFAEVRANLGSVAASQQEWAGAIEYYQQAIALNPKFAGAYRNLARIWERQGDAAKGTRCWYRAHSLEPDAVAAEDWVNLGNRLLGQGCVEEAIASYRQALQRDETLAGAYRNLGMALKAQGKLEEAAICFGKFQKLTGEGDTLAVVEHQNANPTDILPPQKPSQKPSQKEHIDTLAAVENQPPQHTDILLPSEDIDTLKILANAYSTQQQWEKAISACQKILQTQPDADTYKLLGNALKATGNLTAAAKCYQQAIALHPQFAEAYANLGSLAASGKQWQGAIEYYQQAIALNPEFAEAYRNLARVWEDTGNEERAIEAWQQALALEADWATPSEYLILGNRLVASGKLEAARDCYRRVVAVEADNAQAWHNLGEVSGALEEWEEAAAAYEREIALKQEDAGAHRSLGKARLKQENWDGAMAAYRQACELQPENGSGWKHLGDVLKEREIWAEAEEAYQKAIELCSEAFWAHNHLGEVRLKQENWDGAIAAYEKAIALNPEFSWAHHNLGDARLRLADWDGATQAYQKAIELNPEFAWSYYNLGEVLMQQQQWEAAVGALQRVAQLQPETPWLARKLAVALREKARGDLKEAVKWYRQAIAEEPDNLEHYHRALELQPHDAWLYQGLGDALTRQGNTAGAIAFYQMGLQLEPENSALQLGLGNCLLKKKRVITPKNSPKNSSQNIQQYRIAIKTSVPNLEVAREWGDFHFAHALKRAFEKRGHRVRVDCQDAWENPESDRDEVAIVLRGRHGYQPQPNCLNLLWLISHPDRVSHAELNRFDSIFVASEAYTQKLASQLQVPVYCLHQCTDPAIFYPDASEENARQHDVLFVGNSRNIFRPIVRDALAGGIDVAVYGSRWEQFIPKVAIEGEHIPNNCLYQTYSNCQILLNDSWETMRDEGFLSNRLFDASACETFIISDRVAGLTEVFGEAIETYITIEELKDKVNYYLSHESERREKARKAKEMILENHTFDRRVEDILGAIDRLRSKAKHEPIYPENPIPLYYQKVELLCDRGGDLKPFREKLAQSEAGLKTLATPTNPPLVSIIMPTFNRRYIIPEAIQSAIEQTYPNWELFICDDGSTDGTHEAIEEFRDTRIQYLKLSKANGSVARNVGLKRANGEYIAYLDSDNIWHPQHLQVCVTSLIDEPQFKCAYTWAIDSEFEDGNWNLKGTYCQRFNYEKLIERNYIDLNSFCHHRSIYETCGGFDENLLRLQDWDLVLRYLFAYSPKAIEYFTVFYRRNLAWKQVTKLYENTNMREIVRKKAIANLGRDFIDRSRR